MGSSQGRLTRCAEGLGELRAVVGTWQADGEIGVEIDAQSTVLRGLMDVAGKVRQTIYVENESDHPVDLLLRWYVNDQWYEEPAINIPANSTVFTQRHNAATHLGVAFSTADNPVSLRWHAVATVGGGS